MASVLFTEYAGTLTEKPAAMDWTEILKRAGIQEPPGYAEALKAVESRPKPKKKKGKKKG